MAKRTRTYEQYRDLGALLSDAHSSLGKSIVLTSKMFPLNDKNLGRLHRLDRDLRQLRSDLDNVFCSEFPESAVPAGESRLPLYPGSRQGEIDTGADVGA
jgi:hypothetical protein